MYSLWNIYPLAYLCAVSLFLINFPPTWTTRQICIFIGADLYIYIYIYLYKLYINIWPKRRPIPEGCYGPRAGSNHSSTEGQIFWYIKRFANIWGNNRRNLHMLSYGKVILAHTWFNLNFILISVAYFVACPSCIVYLPSRKGIHLKIRVVWLWFRHPGWSWVAVLDVNGEMRWELEFCDLCRAQGCY